MKSITIPIMPLGPGSQVEEEVLEYINMPKEMYTYAPPILPEPEDVANLTAAHDALRSIVTALQVANAGGRPAPVSMLNLDRDNLHLVNQVLGEGEVSARVLGETELKVQESVFAGVWRVIETLGEQIVSDHIEIGAIPMRLLDRARAIAAPIRRIAIPEQFPPGVMNASALLTELNDQIGSWKHGMLPHVINLTLLPLSQEDVVFLDQSIGLGNVVILSRGYGNCRVSSTQIPNCWRVTYYNSQDAIILNTIEIVDIPDVACAAKEDLEDSLERLEEVLQWVVTQ
ncbi:hydrogenase expression/formation protein [Ampullimonas aquatilis]|uniref:hydrogenase expression/formation protein n=1 Tax=Ampullimonas aquatilis TaxID=1341549 RepID=UPI003C744F65